MKLKALASLCAEEKTVKLFDAPDGTQWAGTGACWWRLPENLGELNTDALCAIFDFDSEKQEKMLIEQSKLPEAFVIEDSTKDEKNLFFWMERRLILDGTDMLPLKAPGGEIFCIKTKHLKPGKDAEQPGLCLRRTEAGFPYIVFKDGMFIAGIITLILPDAECVTWLTDVLTGISVK